VRTVNYQSSVVLETVKNYTICVKTDLGIRPMKSEIDINEKLVYVNQIIPDSFYDEHIEKGYSVRYIDIQVIPKFKL
jgi:hypothetical protein